MSREVKSGNPSGGSTAVSTTTTDRRRIAVGRPVVIGLGTLILLLIAVAFFF
jgi:hypothetical protein